MSVSVSERHMAVITIYIDSQEAEVQEDVFDRVEKTLAASGERFAMSMTYPEVDLTWPIFDSWHDLHPTRPTRSQ